MPQTRIRASLVCLHQNKILVFKGIDPQSKKEYWFLPGGKIEATERPNECAERETFEETGYRVKAISDSEVRSDYLFLWNGIEYNCTTYFYRGDLAEEFHQPKAVNDADYNKGAVRFTSQKKRSPFLGDLSLTDSNFKTLRVRNRS